jgi:hypothetical protein
MKITIAALSDFETMALTGSSRFNNLHPIQCPLLQLQVVRDCL